MLTKYIVAFFLIFSSYTSTLSAQVLETEDSKPLAVGQWVAGTAVEFQTSKDGTETAIPFGIEYGLTHRLTILLEPVAYTNIHNKIGISATGIGDLEFTLFYQLFREQKIMPAISLSAEVKFPTAKNPLIGTGKTDFTPFLIASKNIGKFYTSLNLSYTFLGKPTGVVAGNLFNYAVGTIYSASERNIFFGEIYGNTSAFGTDIPEIAGANTVANTPEISGGELVGLVGYGRYVGKKFILSFGISYDNNDAILFRPGIEWSFGKRNTKMNIH